MIETSQLQTLMAVCSSGTFSKAAEKLSVTQSAISQSIKNLEKKLGVQLVKRNGKIVILTQEGERLAQFARKYLSDLGETVEEITSARDEMTGQVRIGTLTGIGKSWLAPELLDFTLENENLKTTIVLGFQEDLVQDFKNNLLDILILPEECLPPVGERLFLSEEKSTLIYSDKFKSDVHEEMTLEEFSSLPTILFENDDPLYYKWCMSTFGKIPKKVNVKYVVNAHGNMLQAVSKGAGVAIVPNHVLIRSHLFDQLKAFGERFEVVNGKFYLLYHRESIELMRIRKTLNHLLSVENPLAVPLLS